jgi:tRNA threonylcarbamoyladenosine biosynthesis protein TsaB
MGSRCFIGINAGFFSLDLQCRPRYAASERGKIRVMSTIIAIETSSELASAALLRDDQLIAREASGVQTHSQSILPMVQELLREAGVTLAQCDAVAFGAGPGSFTGVRTACGIAQGLAFGADLPVVPVVTLLAMAQACREASGASDVLAVMDARMEEVYWAQYRYENGWQTIIEPTLSAASAVAPVGTVVACGNGLSAYSTKFAEKFTTAFGQLPAAPDLQPAVMPHAAHVAQLARIAFAEGRTVAARDAQPIYLRNKVALTTVERLAKVAA